MNKANVLVFTYHERGIVAGEWADRAPDDDDRQASDTIFIYAEGATEKEMWAKLSLAYDEWVRSTRGGT